MSTTHNENNKSLFFTTLESKCVNCKNWKIHQVLSSSTEFVEDIHATCICDLLSFGTVCCPRGFKILLEKQPELVMKIQSPPMLSTLSMLLKQYSSVVDDDSHGEVFLECKEILESAKDYQLSTINNFTDLNYQQDV